MIRIFYFAHLRERLDTGSEQLDLPAGVRDIAGLRLFLHRRGGIWQEIFAARNLLLAAVNQEMAAPESAVREGDEVAFFPPVTGG